MISDTKYMVRRAASGDIPQLLKLLVQVNMVHHNGRPDIFKGPATKYNEEQLEDIIKSVDKPVFVCTDSSGRVVGHAFCISRQIQGDPVLTDIRTLYIDDICVDENCRKTGVGERLYRAVREYAIESGYYNLTLNVWSCNIGAMKFYERMGFVSQKVGMEMVL